MNWTNYFDRILVVNLRKREDRLLHITAELEKYNIPFELITAIENDNGAIGLRDTMLNIFNESIERKEKAILVFEDDAMFLEDPNATMNAVVEQLPYLWDMVFLGCQPTTGFKYRHSANLLQLDGAFSTHAVMYSLQGMKEIVAQGLDAPIDNCYVLKVEKLQRCYVTYPFLATQREGFSDIGKNIVNWRPFLEQKYTQKLADLCNN